MKEDVIEVQVVVVALFKLCVCSGLSSADLLPRTPDVLLILLFSLPQIAVAVVAIKGTILRFYDPSFRRF